MFMHSYEDVKKRALKYKSRRDFNKYDRGAYSWAIRKGVLQEICKHMPYLKPRNIHSKKRSFAILLKYKTLNEFYKKEKNVYVYLKRNGWLKEATQHLKKKSEKRTLSQVIAIIKKYKYWDEFKLKEPKVRNYIRSRLKKNMRDFIPKYIEDRGHPLSWSKDMVLYEMKKYNNLDMFFKTKPAAYQRAIHLGLIVSNKDPIFNTRIWNKKTLLELCKKYSTLGELVVKEGNAPINAAKKLGIKLPLIKVLYTGETYLKFFLEEVLNMKLPKARPISLQNPQTGRNLELDGYNYELQIGFEHNGSYHYKNSFKNKLIQTKKRDKLKKKLCKKNGIKVIYTKDLILDYKMNEIKIKQIIEKQLIQLNIPYDKHKFKNHQIFNSKVKSYILKQSALRNKK